MIPERIYVLFDKWGCASVCEAQHDVAVWDRENPSDVPHVSEPYLKASTVNARIAELERFLGVLQGVVRAYHNASMMVPSPSMLGDEHYRRWVAAHFDVLRMATATPSPPNEGSGT